jgi:organic radical activating enzyme
MTKTYCPFPFKEIYSDNDGRYRVCCHGLEQASMNDMLPFEWFNGEQLNNVRRQMLAGEKPKECFRCWRLEENDGHSWRHEALQNFKNSPERGVGLKLRIGTNFCNLACYMCNPKNSTTRASELLEIYGDEKDEIYNQQFLSPYVSTKNKRWNQILDDILNNIDEVHTIHLTGGEPLQLPQQWKLLNAIPDEAAKNIKIKMDTNLTELSWKDNHLFDLYNKFKKVWLGISCDHYGDKLRFIRYPIDVEKFEKHLKEVRDRNLDHCINITASILNIDDLPVIVKYYENMGMKTRIHAVVQKGIHSICNLPQTLKDEYIDEYWKYRWDLVVSELECSGNLEELVMGLQNVDELAIHRSVQWRKLFRPLLEKLHHHEKNITRIWL